MIEKDLSPARVAAFSDGVIAIIITIMVLELHVPQDFSARGLLAVVPTLASYALSYLVVAIYWVNHHHLFSLVRRVDTTILWANIAMLFFLSLLPFFTAYVGQSHMQRWPVFWYCAAMVACALCYRGLGGAVARTHFNHDERLRGYSHANGRKNMLALMVNVLAVAVALRHPQVAMLMVLAVALLYFVPTTWVGEQNA